MRIGSRLSPDEGPEANKAGSTRQIVEGVILPLDANEAGIDVGDKHLTGWRLFTDGGAWRKNPSPDGGAYSFRMISPDDIFMGSFAAILLPRAIEREGVSNNNTELAAILAGVRFAAGRMSGVDGPLTICSDSQLVLNWMKGTYQRVEIPPVQVEYLASAESLVRDMGLVLDYCLLGGHPSESDLRRGYCIKRGKTTKRAYPVSIHNVQCDEVCGLVMREAFEMKGK